MKVTGTGICWIPRNAPSGFRLGMALFIFLACVPVWVHATVDVLLLNSYHDGYEWSDRIVDAVRNEFAQVFHTVELHVEYLDSKRHPEQANEDNVLRLLEAKYTGHAFKAIIVIHDPAYRFMLKYGDSLFPNCPVVFCGVTDFHFADIEGHSNITGVVETADFAATVDAMLSLLPRTRQIVVIHDDTSSSRGYRKSFERQFEWLRSLYPFLRVTYFSGSDLTTDEMLNRVRELHRGTIAIVIRWVHGKDGRFLTDQQFIPRLSKACAAPLCGTIDVHRDILGGKLISAEGQGQTAARMAMQTFHNVRPAAIPIQMRSVNQFIFDYAQLRRWGIDPARLPVDSIVCNRPDTFYERYRRYIWGSAVFIVIEAVIIVLLVVNMVQRQRLERQRKAWERRMDQARKLEGLGVLAGGIAHDFNNILTVILGNADLLSGDRQMTPSAQALLQDIVDAARQGEVLSREMLAYSGRSHFSRRRISVNELVRESVEIVEEESSQSGSIGMDLGKGLPVVDGDSALIKRAIFNLLTNALEAVGGHSDAVSIRTACVQVRQDFLTTLWLGGDRPEGEGTYLTLTVSDKGGGMDTEALERIFDPFYSTKFTGRGLGLAAVYGIVKRHGGCIDVQSCTGEGTSVTIYLPVAEGEGGNASDDSTTLHEI